MGPYPHLPTPMKILKKINEKKKSKAFKPIGT